VFFVFSSVNRLSAVNHLSRQLISISRPAAVRHIPSAKQRRRKYILFNGPQWSQFGEIKMFTASKRTHLASFSFAVVMAVLVNGSMLVKFDSVAREAALAQSAQSVNVAVLETVTIVGRRI
jgi:hypothetical protein